MECFRFHKRLTLDIDLKVDFFQGLTLQHYGPIEFHIGLVFFADYTQTPVQLYCIEAGLHRN